MILLCKKTYFLNNINTFSGAQKTTTHITSSKDSLESSSMKPETMFSSVDATEEAKEHIYEETSISNLQSTTSSLEVTKEADTHSHVEVSPITLETNVQTTPISEEIDVSADVKISSQTPVHTTVVTEEVDYQTDVEISTPKPSIPAHSVEDFDAQTDDGLSYTKPKTTISPRPETTVHFVDESDTHPDDIVSSHKPETTPSSEPESTVSQRPASTVYFDEYTDVPTDHGISSLKPETDVHSVEITEVDAEISSPEQGTTSAPTEIADEIYVKNYIEISSSKPETTTQPSPTPAPEATIIFSHVTEGETASQKPATTESEEEITGTDFAEEEQSIVAFTDPPKGMEKPESHVIDLSADSNALLIKGKIFQSFYVKLNSFPKQCFQLI